jgi:hypothetical protein
MTKLKRGDVVRVRMNRGPARLGTFVKSHVTGPSGVWWEIKPDGVRGDLQNFRVRPACVSPM